MVKNHVLKIRVSKDPFNQIQDAAQRAGQVGIAPYVREVLTKNNRFLESALCEIRQDVKKILEVSQSGESATA